MDAPLHFVAGGTRISDISIERFFGNGIVIDARGAEIIDASFVDDVVLHAGAFVFVYSGWSEKFGTEAYFTHYPTLSEDFAQAMVDAQVGVVGMDMPSPDRDPYLTHKKLLQNEILIIENLVNLESLLEIEEFNVVALPVKYETEAAPVRVVAYY
jgi:kynurenine formamidase